MDLSTAMPEFQRIAKLVRLNMFCLKLHKDRLSVLFTWLQLGFEHMSSINTNASETELSDGNCPKTIIYDDAVHLRFGHFPKNTN